MLYPAIFMEKALLSGYLVFYHIILKSNKPPRNIMNKEPVLLPTPKSITTDPGDGKFLLSEERDIYVNKAKVQDHVIDFFGFFWKNFKLHLRITAIRDREYKQEYEKGFFMYISGKSIPDSFTSTLVDVAESLPLEGYDLTITPDEMYIISPSIRGFFNGVLTVQQLWEDIEVKKDRTTGKPLVSLPCLHVVDYPDLDLRMVHVDLKQQMHSLEYLKDHVRMLARYKINAILWEWEDKFPYKTRPELQHKLAFNRAETVELMNLCTMYGIESIPLVQTYGHLEFVVKLDKYKHLNEDQSKQYSPDSTLDVCALHEDTMPLLRDMISDMISYHPKSRFLHIGGDEVYTIGTCDRCKQYIKEHGHGDDEKGKSKLYIQHMNKVIKIVKGFGKIPMIWHDYLLKYPEYVDELDKDTIIVYWRYGKDKQPNDFKKEMNFFKDKGFQVLAASSVRSDFQYAIPNYSMRFQNIHELHLALGTSERGKNTGALATSWAVCRSPMETTVPGILHFAESCWNVKKVPFTLATVDFTTKQMLSQYFYMPRKLWEKHGALLRNLVSCTVPPQKANDLGIIAGEIRSAIDAWQGMRRDIQAGDYTVENIVHGLKLQEMKVDMLMVLNELVRILDEYGSGAGKFLSIDGLRDKCRVIDELIEKFELFQYRTREVYEKVIYDAELLMEWKYRFQEPREYLESVRDRLVNARLSLEMLVEKSQAVQDNLVHLDDKSFPRDLRHHVLEIAGNLVKWESGNDSLPPVESLEECVTMVDTMETASIDGALVEIMSEFQDALSEAAEKLDHLIFSLAMEKLQQGFIRRF
ncbi:family 20 glycosylhydrolase [Candidatus Bathyarchaeota archaeon]|nr:family 20 glycosylhydrolase [Candidatus Bathyarchaeota archaeon]